MHLKNLKDGSFCQLISRGVEPINVICTNVFKNGSACFISSEIDYMNLVKVNLLRNYISCEYKYGFGEESVHCFHIYRGDIDTLTNNNITKKSKRSSKFKKLLHLIEISGSYVRVCPHAKTILIEQIKNHIFRKRSNCNEFTINLNDI